MLLFGAVPQMQPIICRFIVHAIVFFGLKYSYKTFAGITDGLSNRKDCLIGMSRAEIIAAGVLYFVLCPVINWLFFALCLLRKTCFYRKIDNLPN
jgi:hypothetical protein